MKKLLLFFTLSLLISCGNGDLVSSSNYEQTLTTLSIQFTSIDSLAKYTNSSKEELVKWQYSTNGVPADLHELLEEILVLYNEGDEEEVIAKFNEGSDLNLEISPKSCVKLTKSEFESQQEFSDTKFQTLIDSISVEYLCSKVNEHIEQEFSIFNIHIIFYRGLFASEEELTNTINEEIKNTIDIESFDKRLNGMIKSYDLLSDVKCDIYGYEIKNTDFSKSIKSLDTYLNSSISQKFLERYQLTIQETMYDLSIDIALTFLILILINAIINFLAKAASGRADTRGFCVDLFTGGIFNSILNFANDQYCDYEIDSIYSKYNNIKWLLNILVFIVMLIAFHYIFTTKAIEMEQELTDMILTSFGNSLY